MKTKTYRNPSTGQLSRPIPVDASERIAILEKAGWELVQDQVDEQPKLPILEEPRYPSPEEVESFTVKELQELADHTDDIEHLKTILETELTGRNRKGVVEAFEARIAELRV